jgi:hypothetical protein
MKTHHSQLGLSNLNYWGDAQNINLDYFLPELTKLTQLFMGIAGGSLSNNVNLLYNGRTIDNGAILGSIKTPSVNFADTFWARVMRSSPYTNLEDLIEEFTTFYGRLAPRFENDMSDMITHYENYVQGL